MGTILFLGADAAYLRNFRGPLMEHFRKRGYRVVAVAPSIKGSNDDLFDDLDVEFRAWPLKRAGLNPLADVWAALSLCSILVKTRPKILFAHTIKPVIYGLTLGRLFGVGRLTAMIPGLGYAFTNAPSAARRMVSQFAILGYRTALTRADMVIFQNGDDIDALRDRGALPPKTQVAVVSGSGVDTQRFAPAAWPSGPPCFLMIARLLRDKGVVEFVEAARMVKAQLPDARFILVGEMDENPSAVRRSEVEAWISEGLVEVWGYLSDPRPALVLCHVFVLPSYREGCPRVNLEAMAMSRPVITTDTAGCRETVRDGETGLLVPPRNAKALSLAMIELAGDLQRAREMGIAARKFCCERFELNEVVAATAALIDNQQRV